MKKALMIAGGFIASASAVIAGTLTEPAVEEMVKVEEAGSSSSGILIPLLIVAVVAAVIASSDDDDDNASVY
ncbi:hypothetical protein GCM10007939_18670 [Amylibacter marinus]|uniref:Ferrochelatase n=1 Tax=Amylibacter marinus TaxID=1475483 RepID=A0ABQ5VWR6_9RHOB|nr:hypothetical protein [Amylibacter marinus]GLQ35584.1 hypothetical protein GCM10007939_18670 [Amylibacter marinus]